MIFSFIITQPILIHTTLCSSCPARMDSWPLLLNFHTNLHIQTLYCGNETLSILGQLLGLCIPVGCKAKNTLLVVAFDFQCLFCTLLSATLGLCFPIRDIQKTRIVIFVILFVVPAFVVF